MPVMDKLVVIGGTPLRGTVSISGAKNAVLPMMAAALLAEGRFRLRNVPDLRDVSTMSHLLLGLGLCEATEAVEFAGPAAG